MPNPLLINSELPKFKQIRSHHILPALDKILTANRNALEHLLQQSTSGQHFTWENLLMPFEALSERLHFFWSTVSHINHVADSKAMRCAYEKCLPKITAYFSELNQNEKLYRAVKSLPEQDEYFKYNDAQKKVINNMLRDFRLAGVGLDKKSRQRLTKLHCKLSTLQNKFSQNVLDATNAWQKLITDQNKLSGLPNHIQTAAAANARSKKLSGWLFTLHPPFFEAVLTYADDRNLRKEFYLAYITRASELGLQPKKLNNSRIAESILKIRREIALILGFKNYAELSLSTKMVRKPKQVLNFLYSLSKKSRTQGKAEMKQLKEFAAKKYGIKKIQPWDLAFYSEKQRLEQYAISDELLRQYFPADQVVNGLFALVGRLFTCQIREVKNTQVWDKTVKFFKISDRQNKHIGSLYLDLFARKNKRSGAWMDSCRTRRRFGRNKIQLPAAYLICNFSPTKASKNAFLNHHEVITLFHECGHCLQHLLTKVDYPEVSGINGVPWDAVELASQFMENWCWQKGVLKTLSRHKTTHLPLPAELLQKMSLAKNYQSAMLMLRQLEFALFDFRLHLEFDPKKQGQAKKILDQVRKEIGVIPVAKENRFQNSFLHIFGGDYAAGYYSYKWAEVLASDAFAKFEEEGLFNKKIAKSFLKNILETGGACDPMQCFKKFRGRKPNVKSLLKHNGISGKLNIFST